MLKEKDEKREGEEKKMSDTSAGKYAAIGRFRVTTEKPHHELEAVSPKSGSKSPRKLHHHHHIHHHHHHSVKKFFGYGIPLSYPEPTIQEETSPNETEVFEKRGGDWRNGQRGTD